MGRSVCAEESVRQIISGLFGTANATQCGLVVGQRGANRDFITLLVRTPPDGSGNDVPSVQWSVDHALQVRRATSGP